MILNQGRRVCMIDVNLNTCSIKVDDVCIFCLGAIEENKGLSIDLFYNEGSIYTIDFYSSSYSDANFIVFIDDKFYTDNIICYKKIYANKYRKFFASCNFDELGELSIEDRYKTIVRIIKEKYNKIETKKGEIKMYIEKENTVVEMIRGIKRDPNDNHEAIKVSTINGDEYISRYSEIFPNTDFIILFNERLDIVICLKMEGYQKHKKYEIINTFYEVKGESFIDRLNKYVKILKEKVKKLANEDTECGYVLDVIDGVAFSHISYIDKCGIDTNGNTYYTINYDGLHTKTIEEYFEQYPDVEIFVFEETNLNTSISLHCSVKLKCFVRLENSYEYCTFDVEDNLPFLKEEKEWFVKMIREKVYGSKHTKQEVEKIENDPISWEEYFMSLAILSSYRSKDPSTKVGACIINPNDNTILSLGYNGFPRGCDDNLFPWGKGNNNEEDNKYPYVVHAELNAILNAHKDLRGSVLYTTLSPCKECTKAIIQAGIKEVIYLHEFGHDDIVRKKMFDHAGVFCRQYRNPNPKNKEITLRLY